MAIQYPDGTWCVRNKDKQYKAHDVTKVDVLAGNGRFGFRVCLDERTAKERQIEKHGEFYRQPKRRKKFHKGNLCHTTPSQTPKPPPPILMTKEEAITVAAIKQNRPPVTVEREPIKPKKQRNRRSRSARMLHCRTTNKFDKRSGKDALAWYRRVS